MIQTAIELTIRNQNSDDNYLRGLVDLRFTPPDNNISKEVVNNIPVEFDLGRLRSASVNSLNYGNHLRDMLFSDSYFWREWEKTYAYTQGLSSRESSILRFRLRLDFPFHVLRWETLPNPINNSPLCFSERILFSRYFESSELAPVYIPKKPNLKALVVVSSPSDLSKFNIAEIDVEGEINRTSNVFGASSIPIIPLPSSIGKKATLNNIIDNLRDNCNILYLVCHGVMNRETNEAALFLENEEGEHDIVLGNEFVQRISNLQNPPSLIILASCQSGSFLSETSGVSVGPLLSKAGVPAVIAMQGNVSMVTIERFMPIFFNQLLSTGRVDLALSIARANLQDRFDWWIPVLFMRVWDGKIWQDAVSGEQSKVNINIEPNIRNRVDRLRELKQLYEEELITLQEYEAKKAGILSEL